jgi:hypothetical protein
MNTPAALDTAALAAALGKLKEATLDLEYAISRIAASKDKTLGEGTAAFRLQRAGECRDSAADTAEEAARILRTLAARK